MGLDPIRYAARAVETHWSKGWCKKWIVGRQRCRSSRKFKRRRKRKGRLKIEKNFLVTGLLELERLKSTWEMKPRFLVVSHDYLPSVATPSHQSRWASVVRSLLAKSYKILAAGTHQL